VQSAVLSTEQEDVTLDGGDYYGMQQQQQQQPQVHQDRQEQQEDESEDLPLPKDDDRGNASCPRPPSPPLSRVRSGGGRPGGPADRTASLAADRSVPSASGLETVIGDGKNFWR